ncbi:ankyrin 2-3/unc44 [Penicillium cinerascens]|uniref:Ankyrin 2-3/unc44 n=1 Tax=Penicillium cinerascens TaxID=70096 RepID=A0A9W9NC73_9EURO|nr:ankyrin 2-3/unc44 [Penicillium cinerascens]KAJ5216249.1 ankyrin 2-3/unc44 [Penicillium cinerascens]
MSRNSDSDGDDAILVGREDVEGFNTENILPLPVAGLVKIREWLQPTPYDEGKSGLHRRPRIKTGTPFLKGFTRSDNAEASIYQILRPGPTNKCLAIACLDYLKSGCLDDYTIKDRNRDCVLWSPRTDDQIETLLQYPFLEYAAVNWSVHSRRAALAGADMLPFYDFIDAFFANEQQFRACHFIKLLLTAGIDPVTPKTSDIHRGWCGNASTTYEQTPLMYACHNGHFKSMVEFIPFLKDPQVLQKALYWEAEKGRADIVGLLLEETSVDVNGKYQGDTALFKAGEGKHPKTIEILLHGGANPNKLCCRSGDEFSNECFMRYPRQLRDEGTLPGWRALHAICRSKHGFSQARDDVEALKCAQLLLDAGANVLFQASDGSTALHHACKHYTSVVKLLMEAGADPTAEDDSGNTPLHTEGKTDKELLPLLLGAGHVNINKRSEKGGKTPLQCRLEGIRRGNGIEFLKYKPDVNVTSPNGDGPLHIYVKNVGHRKIKVIEALVAAGADPNMKNRKGDTPLHTLSRDNIHVATDLLNAGADIEARNNEGQTPLFSHVIPDSRHWEPPIVQFLIDRSARLDTRDYKGRTLLFQCFWEREYFDKLIDLGFNPAAADYMGNTIFHEAVADRTRFKDLGDLKRLSSLGLNIDQPNHSGRTPLHAICNTSENERDDKDAERTLDYILRVCKNVNPQDLEGILPVHLAAAVSEVSMVKLANAGADLSVVTHDDMTVLHIAARVRQPNIISFVLSRPGGVGEDEIKAFINKENHAGATALHYACRSGRSESVKALLEAGADPNHLDKSGDCCFGAAVQFETEKELWIEGNGKSHTGTGLVAAGILIEDEERPYVTQNGDWRRPPLTSEHDTTRLEEIFDLLVLHESCLTSYQGEFSKKNLKICPKNINTNSIVSANWQIVFQTENAFESEKQEFAMKLLGARQYSIFKEISSDLDLGRLENYGKSILNRLVCFGYSDLLACTFNGNAASHYDDPEWCLAAESKNTNLHGEPRIQPLLPTACSRELPNMEMVELLVEKIGVDINARRRGETWGTGSREKGANMELRDENGVTPLHIALDHENFLGLYRKEAARLIIESGADVNAIDNNGNTCLSKAGKDLDLIKLLLDHGATVNGRAIFSVITLGQIDILELLFAKGPLEVRGVGPNARSEISRPAAHHI